MVRHHKSEEQIERVIDARARPRLALLFLASALMLTACAQWGTVPPGAGYSTSDPYHYRCTGNCQAGP